MRSRTFRLPCAAARFFRALGPNSAGKTTLVRMLLGIFWPDAGQFDFSLHGRTPGLSPPTSAIFPKIAGLYKDIPILRTLTYFGVLRGMAQISGTPGTAEHWLERMQSGDRANERLEAFPRAISRRCSSSRRSSHRPAFAILDEPFSGLDPLNQEFFSTLIRELHDDGMTILLAPHQMQIVEKLADRVLLMNQRLGDSLRDNGRDSPQDKIGSTTRAAAPGFGRSGRAIRSSGRGVCRKER